jgi:hypothetical protein
MLRVMSEPEFSEEELRAAYEEQLKAIRVTQILLEEVVTLINLGMRRTGLMPGTEDERDPTEVQLAIEAVRRLSPLIDQVAPEQAPALKDALSQMQMAYVQIGGGGTLKLEEPAAQAQPTPEKPAAASRLWVPGS